MLYSEIKPSEHKTNKNIHSICNTDPKRWKKKKKPDFLLLLFFLRIDLVKELYSADKSIKLVNINRLVEYSQLRHVF